MKKILLILLILRVALIYAQDMETPDSIDKINGKYINQESSFGDKCTLWLKEKSPGNKEFYLEIGFFGDCGGNRIVYTGEYEFNNMRLMLKCVSKTEEEWDDTEDYENTNEIKYDEIIIGNFLQENKIAIEINGKEYLLKRN